MNGRVTSDKEPYFREVGLLLVGQRCRGVLGEPRQERMVKTRVSRVRYSLDSAFDEASKINLICAIISLVVIDPKCLQFQ